MKSEKKIVEWEREARLREMEEGKEKEEEMERKK